MRLMLDGARVCFVHVVRVSRTTGQAGKGSLEGIPVRRIRGMRWNGMMAAHVLGIAHLVRGGHVVGPRYYVAWGRGQGRQYFSVRGLGVEDVRMDCIPPAVVTLVGEGYTLCKERERAQEQ